MKPPWFERPGWKDGLHALIVGVSEYANLPETEAGLTPAHFGMVRLKSPALTAFRIASFLKDRAEEFVPKLATCRVLLAPSNAELAVEPALAGFEVPDFVNFSAYAEKWRTDALAGERGMTLFYFAGHGVQRERRDHVLVLHNFNDGIGGTLSNKGVNVDDLFDGMAASAGQEHVANAQLYFFDTCRINPEGFQQNELMSVGSFWNVKKVPQKDERVRPSFFASKPGGTAFAKAGQETLFGGALLKCLRGGAAVEFGVGPTGDPEWAVTVNSLIEPLDALIDLANREEAGAQEFVAQNIGHDVALLNLAGPPEVPVTLRIDPEEAAALASVSVIDADDNLLDSVVPFEPNPLVRMLRAGHFRVRAEVNPARDDLRTLLNKHITIKPPAQFCRLLLSLPQK